MSAASYASLPVVRQKRYVAPGTIDAMAEATPRVAESDIADLASRYPTLSRSRIELALDAYWPATNEVEAALLAAVARQHKDSAESLDYTVPVEPAAPEAPQPPRL